MKRCQGVRVQRTRLIELVDGVCRRFGVDRATVSVGIVGDAEIAELNRRFLNHKGTTDCLSFDLSENRGKRGGVVFDLIVNAEMADRQGAARGHSAAAELALYVTHALLHQLGFDDMDNASAGEMHRTEDEILQHYGYGSVYNDRTRPTETG
ncbi:MAG TPA: rRNA maturation RNase YbeY [Phycisphaerae bacterium]|nr:rRNA maturation RNase YbeY [Phycisphaerae bacterium]